MRKLYAAMLGVGLLAMMTPTIAQAQLKRLSAQYRRWDGGEDSTATAPSAGGTNIYTKTVSVAPGQNVLFITYSSTGDTHTYSADNSMQLLCLVDGIACNTGTSFSSGLAGWTVVQRPCVGAVGGPCDEHDNGVTRMWCANITPSTITTTHTVAINLGSTNGLDSVFNEASFVFVDSAKLAPATGGCTKSTTPAGPTRVQ